MPSAGITAALLVSALPIRIQRFSGPNDNLGAMTIVEMRHFSRKICEEGQSGQCRDGSKGIFFAFGLGKQRRIDGLWLSGLPAPRSRRAPSRPGTQR